MQTLSYYQRKKEYYDPDQKLKLGVINPDNLYTAPQMKVHQPDTKDIQLNSSQFELQDHIPVKMYNNGIYISNALEKPFVYIQEVVPKRIITKENDKTQKKPPIIWDKSQIVDSKRVTKQKLKSVITEQTMTGKDLKTKQARDEFYHRQFQFQNLLNQFFEDLKICETNKLYLDYLMEKMKLSKKNKSVKNIMDPGNIIEKTLKENKSLKIDKVFGIYKIEYRVQNEEINFSQFQEFIKMMGILDVQQVQQIFDLCKIQKARPKNLDEDNDDLSRFDKINMKAFFFNYNKYFKDQNRIFDLTSTRGAISKDKKVIQKAKEFHDKTKYIIRQQIDEVKENKEIAEKILQKMNNQNFELYKQRYEQSKDILQSMNMTTKDIKDDYESSLLPNPTIELFNKQCDCLFFLQKCLKELYKFLTVYNQNELFYFDKFSQNYRNLLKQQQNYLNVFNYFLQSFQNEKNHLRENTTNIYQITNFLFEKKYSKEDCEIISILIKKFKKNNNINDSMEKFKISLLQEMYEIICEKYLQTNDSIAEFMKYIERYEKICEKFQNKHIKPVVQQNVAAYYTIKYLYQTEQNYDQQLRNTEKMLEKIIVKYKTETPMERNLVKIYKLINEIYKKTRLDQILEEVQSVILKGDSNNSSDVDLDSLIQSEEQSFYDKQFNNMKRNYKQDPNQLNQKERQFCNEMISKLSEEQLKKIRFESIQHHIDLEGNLNQFQIICLVNNKSLNQINLHMKNINSLIQLKILIRNIKNIKMILLNKGLLILDKI